MTDKDLKGAISEFYWRHHRHRETDEVLKPFLAAKPCSNWLERARKTSLLSMASVSDRMGSTRSNYARLESCETKATIETMQKAAAAMDCEFVYAIRPRAGHNFMMIVWNAIYPAIKDSGYLKNPYKLHLRAAALVNGMLYDPHFRKKQGWVKNTEQDALTFCPREVSRLYSEP